MFHYRIHSVYIIYLQIKKSIQKKKASPIGGAFFIFKLKILFFNDVKISRQLLFNNWKQEE